MKERIAMDQDVRAVLMDRAQLPAEIEVRDRKYYPDSPVGFGFKSVTWKVMNEVGSPRALKLATYSDYTERSYIDELSLAARLEQYREFVRLDDATVIEHDVPGHGTQQFVAFVEEWVEGLTLKEYLASHSDDISPRFCVEYVSALCGALYALQTNGLVHDDLHMGNVMLASPTRETLSDYWIIKIIDLGSLKPEAEQKSPEERRAEGRPEDVRRLAEHIVAILNALHRRRNLSHRERRFLALAQEPLSMMVESDPAIALRDPRGIRDQFESAWGRASDLSTEDYPTLQDPFDFISAEHMADDRLLVDIFARSCPWLKEVTGPDPCLVTGPRGCGKSTMFRWLSLKAHLHKPSESMEDLRLVGFYLSCSSDLQNRIGWIKDDVTATKFRRSIIHYFNLLLLREVLQTLNGIATREDRDSYWGFSASSERNIYEFVTEALPEGDSGRLQGVPRLIQAIQLVETEMSRSHQQMLRGTNAEKPLPETFLGDLTELLKENVDAFKTKTIAFLIDDFSDHRLPAPVQAELNRVIWERRASHVFKLSAENLGANLTDAFGAPIDVTREMISVDCGREFVALDDTNQRQKARTFAVELLDRRLEKAGYRGRAEDLLGHSESSSLAHALVDRAPGRSQDQYHGIERIADLCSGDMSTLLLVYRRIFERGRVGKETVEQVPKRMQDAAITEVSRDLLRRLRTYYPHGPEMYEVANQFGTLVRKILEQGRWQKKGETRVPSQCPRIELDQKRGEILEELDESQRGLAEELLKRAVFIEMDQGLSRHGNVTTGRWQFRRIFLPSFRAALAKNNAVKRGQPWLKFFLSNPAGACDAIWKSWPKEKDADELENGQSLSEYQSRFDELRG